MSVIGTPDNQRGVVNAGKLLASVAGATTSETVTLPPNAETLVVVIPGRNYAVTIHVVGVTTGIKYPGVARFSSIDTLADVEYYFPVSSQLDAQVTITLGAAPGVTWYVYVDTAVQAVSTPDVAILSQSVGAGSSGLGVLVFGVTGGILEALSVDAAGQLKVLVENAVSISGTVPVSVAATLNTIDQNIKNAIAALGAALPADGVLVGGSDGTDLRALSVDTHGYSHAVSSPPGSASGDHPGNELKYAYINAVTGDTVIVAAPGVGQRLRLFEIGAELFGSATDAQVDDTTNIYLRVGSTNLKSQRSFLPSGFPIGANTEMRLHFNAAGVATNAWVTYTVETV